MSGKRGPRAEEEVSPNLIPMIDIMFLLLLFFMLGADMGQRELEEVRLPEVSSVTPVENAADVTVNVHHAQPLACATYGAGTVCADPAHWSISVRGQPCSADAIRSLLQLEVAARGREGRVMIRADQAALYGVVQRVMNACAEVGLYKVELGAAQPI